MLIQIGIKHFYKRLSTLGSLRALLIQIGIKHSLAKLADNLSLRALGLRYNRDTEEKA